MAKKGNATSASPQGRDSAAPLRKQLTDIANGAFSERDHRFFGKAFWTSVVREGFCSKQELAACVGCQPAHVFDVISNFKKPSELEKIAKALGFGTN